MILSDEEIQSVYSEFLDVKGSVMEFARRIERAVLAKAQEAAIPEYNENVPADCLSPTVAKARRYGDPKNILSAAPKQEGKL